MWLQIILKPYLTKADAAIPTLHLSEADAAMPTPHLSEADAAIWLG